jgi:hypothetical protein
LRHGRPDCNFQHFSSGIGGKRLFGEGEILQHLSQDGRTGGSMSKLSRLVLHVAHALGKG